MSTDPRHSPEILFHRELIQLGQYPKGKQDLEQLPEYSFKGCWDRTCFCVIDSSDPIGPGAIMEKYVQHSIPICFLENLNSDHPVTSGRNAEPGVPAAIPMKSSPALTAMLQDFAAVS